jgi:hypothetical protein
LAETRRPGKPPDTASLAAVHPRLGQCGGKRDAIPLSLSVVRTRVPLIFCCQFFIERPFKLAKLACYPSFGKLPLLFLSEIIDMFLVIYFARAKVA